jgi:hypothetical protein
VDSKGVAWTVLASGQIASFDRKKCKGPLNGPTTAEGTHCPEGWTLYRLPGPQFKMLRIPMVVQMAHTIFGLICITL